MAQKTYSSRLVRAQAFTDRLGIRLPILLAPMAGAARRRYRLLLPMPAVWARAEP